MDINYSEMVSVLAKDGDEILSEMSGAQMHLMHMAIGIVGESTELLDALRGGILDYENITEELGDNEFYMEGLRQGLGIKPVIEEGDINENENLLGAGVSYVVNAGLLLDCVKRYTIYQKDIDKAAIVELLQAMAMDLNEIRQKCDISWLETIEHNVDKLGKRYQGFVYTNQAAIARADKV